MTTSELAVPEAVTISGINRIDLYHKNGSCNYEGSALCRAIVIAPAPLQAGSPPASGCYARVLRLYKRQFDDPEQAECQQEIPLGERVLLEHNGNSLQLKISEFELDITPMGKQQLKVSRKSFAGRDANTLSAEVNRYISQCIRDAS